MSDDIPLCIDCKWHIEADGHSVVQLDETGNGHYKFHACVHCEAQCWNGVVGWHGRTKCVTMRRRWRPCGPLGKLWEEHDA